MRGEEGAELLVSPLRERFHRGGELGRVQTCVGTRSAIESVLGLMGFESFSSGSGVAGVSQRAGRSDWFC